MQMQFVAAKRTGQHIAPLNASQALPKEPATMQAARPAGLPYEAPPPDTLGLSATRPARNNDILFFRTPHLFTPTTNSGSCLQTNDHK